MARYCVYIDGFNMYYALKRPYPQFKWLNYRTMAEAVIGPKDTLSNVVYFSAFATWKPAQVADHKEYIKALRWANVEVVMGKFRRKDVLCHLCHRRFVTHEEKRTDVHIAVRTVRDAVLDEYDKAILVTADSDLIPVIQTVHEIAPAKEVGVMLPIGKSSYELKAAADFSKRMPQDLLARCQLPPRITSGTTTITKPADWP